jgi:hypothetical protein
MAWVEWGHIILLHIIPHMAGLSSNPLYIGFLGLAHMNTTIHLMGSLGLTVQWPLMSRIPPSLSHRDISGLHCLGPETCTSPYPSIMMEHFPDVT